MKKVSENEVKEADMRTLIDVIKLIDGKEYWFRIEGTNELEIIFVGGY